MKIKVESSMNFDLTKVGEQESYEFGLKIDIYNNKG